MNGFREPNGSILDRTKSNHSANLLCVKLLKDYLLLQLRRRLELGGKMT